MVNGNVKLIQHADNEEQVRKTECLREMLEMSDKMTLMVLIIMKCRISSCQCYVRFVSLLILIAFYQVSYDINKIFIIINTSFCM